jgi:osmotically-inducible protein OsmY
MRWTFALLTIVFAGLMCGPQVVCGQQMGSSSGGQSGMFGSRSLGSTLSAGQGSFSGSSMGMGSQMGGQMGSSGSSRGFGSSMGGQSNSTSVGGQARRAGDFVGVNAQQQAGRGFVGAVQATGAAGASQSNYGAGISPIASFGSGQGRMGQGSGMYGAGRYGAQGRSNASLIRTELSVGFDAPAANSQKLSSTLTQQLAGLPALHWRTPGQVEIQGRMAILRGVVATEHDRDLAERVVRLAPGVEQVQNQLVVASSAKSAKSPAAASEGQAATPSAPADSSKGPAAANSQPAQQPALE